jgi:transcriptional regulator with XRE-family HTH domain
VGRIIEAIRKGIWTRPLPRATDKRVGLLLKAEKGSTRAVADRLGVSQRTVQRYIKGTQQPRGATAERLAQEAAKVWQPRVTARARKQAETNGAVVDVIGRIGYRAPIGSSDDPRIRHLTQLLPPQHVRSMWDAYEAGDERALEQAMADGLGEVYFRNGGQRAPGLGVSITDLEHVEIDWT